MIGIGGETIGVTVDIGTFEILYSAFGVDNEAKSANNIYTIKLDNVHTNTGVKVLKNDSAMCQIEIGDCSNKMKRF